MTLKDTLTADMKTALKAGDKPRLGVLRMALAAVKQQEVDGRKTLDDAEITAVIDKMVKQRRDSVKQFREGGREDLAEREAAEIAVLEHYLPEQLDETEIAGLIDEAIAATGAQSMRDMGKVMGELRPKVQGRADMSAVSARVKERLAG